MTASSRFGRCGLLAVLATSAVLARDPDSLWTVETRFDIGMQPGLGPTEDTAAKLTTTSFILPTNQSTGRIRTASATIDRAASVEVPVLFTRPLSESFTLIIGPAIGYTRNTVSWDITGQSAAGESFTGSWRSTNEALQLKLYAGVGYDLGSGFSIEALPFASWSFLVIQNNDQGTISHVTTSSGTITSDWAVPNEDGSAMDFGILTGVAWKSEDGLGVALRGGYVVGNGSVSSASSSEDLHRSGFMTYVEVGWTFR